MEKRTLSVDDKTRFIKESIMVIGSPNSLFLLIFFQQFIRTDQILQKIGDFLALAIWNDQDPLSIWLLKPLVIWIIAFNRFKNTCKQIFPITDLILQKVQYFARL